MISIEDDTSEEERRIRPQRDIIIITGTAGEHHYRQAIEAMLKQDKHPVYTVAAHPNTLMSTTTKEKPLDLGNPHIFKAKEQYEPEPKYDKPKSNTTNNKQFKNNHMIDVNAIKLKQDILLVDEMEVVVSETSGGVQLTKEEIDHRKKSRVVRFGTIVSTGDITDEVLQSSSFKGKQKEELIGKIVMYTVHSVDTLIDSPIDNVKRPILIRLDYIYAEIQENPNAIGPAKQ